MAERFSRFRDAGTGIQVFLPPVPPVGSASSLAVLLLPVSLVLGVIRILALVLVITLWTLLISTFGLLGRGVQATIHASMGRLFLLVVGFAWISSETVSLRNRGRSTQSKGSFSPQKGDLILSNWSSWVDVLYLLIAFHPTFVRPIVTPHSEQPSAQQAGGRQDDNARRRGAAARGQQHADVSRQEKRTASGAVNTDEERVVGWTVVDFTAMLFETGLTPPVRHPEKARRLEDIIKEAPSPVVVFPELVTSNNRGLLSFERIFPHSWRSLFRATGALRIGKGQANLFVMSIKHEPPTQTAPSTTLSVPSSFLSPLPHIVRLCFSPSTYALAVRQLSEDESPTHAAFTADPSAAQRPNALTEKCADLMSSLSRLRRTDLGWQDKEAFLALYNGKRK